jgi:hypothetical protein
VTPRTLLHGVEVDLVAQVSVGALKVGCELTTQLHPGGVGPLRQAHEPRAGHTGRSHWEIVGQDGHISPYDEDQCGVDLQKLSGVDTPIVLLRQVGLKLAWPDHHAEVWGKHHPATPRSHRGRRGVSSLPHRGGVHHIKVPVEVVTLAATPLPLALNGDMAILTRATMLELSSQIRSSEACYA